MSPEICSDSETQIRVGYIFLQMFQHATSFGKANVVWVVHEAQMYLALNSREREFLGIISILAMCVKHECTISFLGRANRSLSAPKEVLRYAPLFQFLREMSSVWTWCARERLGIFSPDDAVPCPLSDTITHPREKPNLKPHAIWIKV